MLFNLQPAQSARKLMKPLSTKYSSDAKASTLETVYDVAVRVASYIALPFFLLSTRGKTRVSERFGAWNLNIQEPFIWVHGASVGEVGSLLPIIKRIRDAHPEVKILLTSTSATGLERGAGAADESKLLPFDCMAAIEKALGNATPKLFVFGETELWPSLLRFLSTRRVPCIMVNGRISARSLKRYQVLLPLFSRALARITQLHVSNDASKDRFIALGADPEKLFVSGNAKYDRNGRKWIEESSRTKSTFFKEGVPILTLGSIRPGEEEIWFPAIARVLRERLLNVVIAPRHKEKFEFFSEALGRAGISFRRWSANGSEKSIPVLLLDAMGELERFYAVSELAFVGGTLVPEYGGHNPLEPAQYRCCVVLGPYGSVIEEIRADLRAASALHEIRDVEDAYQLMLKYISSPESFESCRQQARVVWDRYSGAASRVAGELERFL
jgi:3-deoxy-D-manno-octulosonic-acid transferase